jgi:hypothetical protein
MRVASFLPKVHHTHTHTHTHIYTHAHTHTHRVGRGGEKDGQEESLLFH